jgi:carboxypeptidase C (cathepsin A)
LVGSALVGLAAAKPEEDRVLYLPEMGNFDKFAAFSGYVDISKGKKIHYMFVESQTSPTTQPVVIWFNGGPGCSSMLGFTQEHGPFVINDGTSKFVENEWTWNMEANMLYIEQPAGVGYSYCDGVENCTFDDDVSGKDNLNAVLAWFQKFPEFQTNELYISGESYAGIYVPYLAHYIDQHNTQYAADDTVFKPNLKGFMVGNGVTNWEYDTTNAYVDMAFWHSLYEIELYNQFKSL